MNDTEPSLSISESYARVIGALVVVGFLVLAASFLIFALSLLPVTVGAQEMAGAWHLRASELAAQTGFRGGWHWLATLPGGDALAAGSLALLAGITIIAFAITAVLFFRLRDFAYSAIVVAQIIILLYAAVGGAAGH